MKYSQLYILIANMFFVGSYLAHGIGGLMMLVLGGIWMISAVFCYSMESRIEILERLRKRLQFEMILNLLKDHPNRRSKK